MQIAKTFFSLLVTLSLIACNGEDVHITKVVPSADSATSPANPTRGTDLIRTRPGPGDSTVYFSILSTSVDQIPVLTNGAGFLSSGAKTTQPFSFHFLNRDLPFNARLSVPTTEGLLYSFQSGVDESTIGKFDPRSHQSETVLTLNSSRLIELAATEDLKQVGWVNQQGEAWIMAMDTRKAVQLPTGELKAVHISLSNSNPKIAVTVNSESGTQLLLFTPEQVTPRFSRAGIDPALSPQGNKIALVLKNVSKNVLAIADSDTDQVTPAVQGDIRAPAWKDERSLTYILTTEQSNELHLLDTESGKDTVIALLHFSGATAEPTRLVCASWDTAGRVYFSDFQNSRFSIYRATQVNGIWATELFASSNGDHSGLTCPKLISRSAS